MSKPTKKDEIITGTMDNLYRKSWDMLRKEEQELQDHFRIARNMACTEWSVDFIGEFFPNRMLPEKMGLLHQNYEQLRSEISFRRYCLIKAYMPFIKNKVFFVDDARLCYEWWEGEMKKKNPDIGHTPTEWKEKAA